MTRKVMVEVVCDICLNSSVLLDDGEPGEEKWRKVDNLDVCPRCQNVIYRASLFKVARSIITVHFELNTEASKCSKHELDIGLAELLEEFS